MSSFNRNHYAGVLSRYVNEFCSPVVVTVTTAEVESTCLKNGLLLHELLGAFSQLDSVNCQVRLSTHSVSMSDAHVRFERSSELRVKTGTALEERVAACFRDNDLRELPASADGFSSAAMEETSGWSKRVEDCFMHSMSFDESEAMSQPAVVLSVVSTKDVDPVACMQELVSSHHVPACLTSGQYDPQVISPDKRVFCVLHDVSGWGNGPGSSDEPLGRMEAGITLAKIKHAFPAATVHLLMINSLPRQHPNVQQPDIWSRWIVPQWFPAEVHALKPGPGQPVEPLPTNPNSGAPALGCRLSMEDFIACRDFCFNLFTGSVLPCLEKRLFFLTKQVNESKKGVRNFFKGLLRKPREEVGTGGLRYPVDRIEAQTVLLADTSFMIGDYDGAAAHYRLARDDFKADRSTAHYMHCSLMLALCHCITEPTKPRDRREHVDAVWQLLSAGHSAPSPAPPNGPAPSAPPQMAAYYALLCSELLMSQKHAMYRSPLDAAYLLSQAAALYAPEHHVASLAQRGNIRGASPQQLAYQSSLVCALLHERAAACFLAAGRYRHFSLHKAVAGVRYRLLPPTAAFAAARRQAAPCFSAALLLYERGEWDGIKTKLYHSLVDGVKDRGGDSAQRAYVLIAQALEACLTGQRGSEECTGGGGGAALTGLVQADAVQLLSLLTRPGPWGGVYVTDGRFTGRGGAANSAPRPQWTRGSSRGTLLSTIPITAAAAVAVAEGAQPPAPSPSPSPSTVEGLSVPQIDLRGAALLVPHNGSAHLGPAEVEPGHESELHLMHKRLKLAFRTEKAWAEERRTGQGQGQGQQSSGLAGGAAGSSLPPPPGSAVSTSTSTSNSTSDGAGAGAVHSGVDAAGAGEQDLARRFAVTELELSRATRKEAQRGPAERRRLRVPVGEPLVLRLPLTNKLPVPLSLTEMRLEFPAEHASSFAVAASGVDVPADCAGGPVYAEVSAVPSKTGTYEIPAVSWQLGSLRVRRQLLRPGARLHATQEQRALGSRSAALLPCFDVVAPHPLLHMRAEASNRGAAADSSSGGGGDTRTCLEGELHWISFSIENQGLLAAGQLQIKTDRPYAVWYMSHAAPDLAAPSRSYDGARLATFGQSGTIALLPVAATVPPGGVLHIGAYVRFPRAGARRFNVLLSYSGMDSKTGEAVPFGPGPRCRTAFLPMKVQVQPSACLKAHVTDCLQATPGVRHLLVEVRNAASANMPAPVAAAAAAAGQAWQGLALSPEEGRLEICEVLALGGVQAAAPEQQQQQPRLVAPQEAAAFCLPVLVSAPGQSQVSSLWALDSSSSSSSASSEEMVVLCQMMGLLRANAALERAAASARVAVEQEERDNANKGPKSIQHLRRENRANAGGTDADADADADADEDGAGGWGDEDDGSPGGGQIQLPGSGGDPPPALPLPASHRGRSRSVGWRTSQLFSHYMCDAADIARAEASRSAATLIVRWCWRGGDGGERRSGVHWAGSFPILQQRQPAAPAAAAAAAASPSVLAEHLLVGLRHTPRAVRPAGSTAHARVPVTLQLRSVFSARMFITVCVGGQADAGFGADSAVVSTSASAGAERARSPPPTRLGQTAGAGTGTGAATAKNRAQAQAQAAVVWQGKVRHLDVPLDAGCSLDLLFVALLPRAGVYDVNCFSITASAQPAHAEPTRPASVLAAKPLLQPSLLTVL